MPPIFFSPLFFKKTQMQLHSLKTKTLTINLSLFNIISVHFHRFGPPFNKGTLARLDSVLWLNSWLQKVKCPFAYMKGWKMCIGMQQWMSALLDDGFVAVEKLKDKQGWLTSVRQWLRRQDLAFYRAGIHALVKWWTKTVEMDADYIEKWQINRQCFGFQAM